MVPGLTDSGSAELLKINNKIWDPTGVRRFAYLNVFVAGNSDCMLYRRRAEDKILLGDNHRNDERRLQNLFYPLSMEHTLLWLVMFVTKSRGENLCTLISHKLWVILKKKHSQNDEAFFWGVFHRILALGL